MLNIKQFLNRLPEVQAKIELYGFTQPNIFVSNVPICKDSLCLLITPNEDIQKRQEVFMRWTMLWSSLEIMLKCSIEIVYKGSLPENREILVIKDRTELTKNNLEIITEKFSDKIFKDGGEPNHKPADIKKYETELLKENASKTSTELKDTTTKNNNPTIFSTPISPKRKHTENHEGSRLTIDPSYRSKKQKVDQTLTDTVNRGSSSLSQNFLSCQKGLEKRNSKNPGSISSNPTDSSQIKVRI